MDQPRVDARPHSRPADANGNEADQAAASPSPSAPREALQRPRVSEVSPVERQQSADQQTEAPANRASVPDSRAGRTPDRQPQAGAPAADRTGLPPPPVSAADAARQRWAERLEEMENPPSSRNELRSRLNELEPGHPSSPWHEDGTPRDPAPRLSELERPRPPLTDTEYAEHRSEVAKKLELAREQNLTTERLYTINPNRDIWTAERSELHADMIDFAYAQGGDVPCERQAIIVGGLGGAGKTSLLDRHADVDRSSYLTINPDSFKEDLARNGMIPEVDGLSPMEASSLAHEESSHLARQLALRAWPKARI